MEDIEHRQAYAHDSQVEVGHGHGLLHLLRRARDEAAQEGPSEQQHGGGDDHGGAQGDGQRGPHPLADAAVPPGPQVLADIGDHGVAVGGGGDLQDAVEFVGGGEAGDKQHAEAVDHELDNHAADGDNAVLERHGRAQGQQLGGLPGLEAEVGAL